MKNGIKILLSTMPSLKIILRKSTKTMEAKLKSIAQNPLARKFSLLFFLIIITPIYIFKLNIIPTSVHGDEGETALQAIQIVKGNVGLIGVGWFDLPLLSFVPHAITMAIVDTN